MIIPPKVDGEWIGREDKHAAAGKEEILPYTPPLIYSLIREHIPNAELQLIEAQRDGLSVEEVISNVHEMKPDIIVSFLAWTHIPWDRKCAETKFPTIAVILQQYIDQREAVELYDLKSRYFVKQELEMPIVEALKEFEQSNDIKSTRGFLIRDGQNLIDTGDAPLADITRFPLPAFDVFEPEKYYKLRESNPFVQRHPVRIAHFNTMKGCPFKCTYCGQASKGQGVRYQTTQQVIKQIDFFVRKYNVFNFVFFDNEFAVNLRRAKEICREIISKKLKVKYIVNNRVELFDDDLIELMANSGCESVKLGIETCDPSLQRYVNKKIDLNMAKMTISRLRDAGVRIHLYMTPGIPGETKESLKMNAHFIADVDPNTFSTGPLFLMPNSTIYKHIKKSGKLLETDWSKYRSKEKLCYINESYKNIGEILNAERYLRMMAYFYLFINKLRKGRVNIGFFYCFIAYTRLGSLIRSFFLRIEKM
ncbi:MAG: B12-binding domain-containing radical SAM protein [Candidatus Hodarchaeota archaeon]